MEIGYVKGYDIITVSKKKAEKTEISEELSEAVNDEELRAKMLDALENGGRVYALRRKKKIYACTIFAKTERPAAEILDETNRTMLKKDSVKAYELVGEYFAPALEERREKIFNDFLADLKEYASINDCGMIICKDCRYIHKKLEDPKKTSCRVALAAALLALSIILKSSGFTFVAIIMICSICSSEKWSKCAEKEQGGI